MEYLMKEKLKKSELETVPELQEGLFPQELPLADLEMADAPEEAEEAEDLFVLFEHKDKVPADSQEHLQNLLDALAEFEPKPGVFQSQGAARNVAVADGLLK